jgi:hypothetical protein
MKMPHITKILLIISLLLSAPYLLMNYVKQRQEKLRYFVIYCEDE